MNPQYMNQPGPPGPNTQPFGGQGIPTGPPQPGNMRPGQPIHSMNGPMSYGVPPPGQGNAGAPIKSQAGSMPNGPTGPQGDPFSMRNGIQNPGMGGPGIHPNMAGPPHNMGGQQNFMGVPPSSKPVGPPPNVVGGSMGPPPPGGFQQGLSNQMGAMNLGGSSQQPPPRPGMQLPPFSQNTGMPPGPPHPSGPAMQRPPSVNNPHLPPTSFSLPPSSTGMSQPSAMPGAPPPNVPGPNPMGQFPPPGINMGGMQPPNYMMGGNMPPPPPSSQPPNTMMGGNTMPPHSTGNNAMPPNSMMSGNLPPPTSLSNSIYNQNYPQNYPQSTGGGPITPPHTGPQGFAYNGPQAQPGGGYPPPPGPSGMQRAPSPSGGLAGPQQQPRKLDPDNMPSPIQVMETDKETRSGVFQTGSRGTVPPLCTSNFIVEDMGNSSPRFIRSTLYNIPISNDMLTSSKVPFAVTISPFAKLLPAEHDPPIVDLGQLGPIRCNRCKAYMCPYMQFIDGGRRFQCAFCNCATEVPAEYFSHLDHTGRRTDFFDRPELCLGTYEILATQDYCKNSKLPNPPAFIFMIDVSYNSVKTGLVNLWCERLKTDILYNLPKDYGAEESEIRVGFVTYHKELHFYNVKGSLTQPQMMVVSDIEDVFVPILDGFLVKLSESETVIDSLLSQIPHMFSESRETEIVLGPVIQAGLDALVSAESTGKLFIFHSSLPVAQAPGMLKNRDDRKVLGTDKEKTILTPQTNFYTKLGQECVAAGCSVELFLFPNSYVDVATVSEVPRLTGGGVHKYQYFQADLDGERFIDDLRRHVEKPVAFDCVMRVRTSTGIRPVDFFGNFHMSNTTDVDLASIDCDKAVTVEIKHDDKLSEADGAYLQAAVLYTSVGGKRRLRIVNQSFNCCSQMADLFRGCELDALMNYMSKHALRSTINDSPKQVREHIMSQCASILACYRQKCASPSSAGQLILPEGMKLLPVYSNCLLKTSMLQGGGDISTDERSLMMFSANAMPVKNSQCYLYPRLIPLHTLDVDSNSLPVAIRCSYERLQDNGAYLIENGLVMIMWVGLNIDGKWLQDVFAAHSIAQIDIDQTVLQQLDNPLSKRINSVIKKIREKRKKYLKLIIVRQRDKLEPLFQQYLVEDRSANAQASYVDFLCHIHKEIRNLLN